MVGGKISALEVRQEWILIGKVRFWPKQEKLVVSHAQTPPGTEHKFTVCKTVHLR
jgi:hypothetical protein